MTIGEFLAELQKLGIERFCFRVHHDKYEAMTINEDGDVFGIADVTVEGAAISLIDALKTRNILGGEGWDELLNPNLN